MIRVALAEGIALDGGPGDLRIAGPSWILPLSDAPPPMVDALVRLAAGESTLDGLVDPLARHGGDLLPAWYATLHRLGDRSALRYRVVEGNGGGLLAEWRPSRSLTRGAFPPDPPPDPVVLSRFAFLRPAPGGLVLESPLAVATVRVHAARTAALLGALCRPTRLSGMVEEGRAGLPRNTLREIVALLHATGFLTAALEDGATAEDLDPVLRPWGLPDLAYHVAAGGTPPSGGLEGPDGEWGSGGDQADPYAGTERVVPLPDVTGDDPAAEASSLERLLAVRRSRRTHDDGRPVTRRELSRFLQLVARDAPARPEESAPPGRIYRRYPSGGACYPLELYVVARRCVGLDRGLYRYEPGKHTLQGIAAPPSALDALLGAATAALGARSAPQLLLIQTADLARSSVRYGRAALALALAEVGVLCEAMYLVATDLGLAACALGSVDGATLQGVLTRRGRAAEVAVGGFALGRPVDAVDPPSPR